MARHKIYIYKDFLANVYNVLGMLLFLMGLFSLFSKNPSIGGWCILIGLVLYRKAACRAAKVPLRIPANAAGIAMLILQVLVIVERLLNGTLTTSLTVTGIVSLLLPLILAVVLLGKFVKNKPVTVALVFFADQIISLIPLLSVGFFGFLFQQSGVGGIFALVISLLPGIAGLIMFLRAGTMTAAEQAFFI